MRGKVLKKELQYALLAILSAGVMFGFDSAVGKLSVIIADKMVMQLVVHFLLMYLFWCGIIVLIKYFYYRMGVTFHYRNKPSKKELIDCLLLFAVTFSSHIYNWSGSKVYIDKS